MSTLKEQRQALLDNARGVVDAAKADGDRALSDPEQVKVKGFLDAVEGLDETIARAEKSQAIVDGLFGYGEDVEESTPGRGGSYPAKSHLSLSKTAPALFEALHRKAAGVASLVPIEFISGVVPATRTPLSLLEAIPAVRRTSPVYRFYQETTRTPNAGMVAPGGVKPESDFVPSSVDARLKVIATLSAPIDKFLVENDAPGLAEFIQSELVDAVQRKIESQIVTGDGLLENFVGFNSISGVQTVTGATTLLTGLRSALTKLQTASVVPSFWAVNPVDFELAQTTRNTSGNFDWAPDQPIGGGRLEAWGVPIVPTSAVVAGTAWAVGEGAVQLSVLGGMEVEWDRYGDLFKTNQMICRAETRANLDALRPFGLVKITLAA